MSQTQCNAKQPTWKRPPGGRYLRGFCICNGQIGVTTEHQVGHNTTQASTVIYSIKKTESQSITIYLLKNVTLFRLNSRSSLLSCKQARLVTRANRALLKKRQWLLVKIWQCIYEFLYFTYLVCMVKNISKIIINWRCILSISVTYILVLREQVLVPVVMKQGSQKNNNTSRTMLDIELK